MLIIISSNYHLVSTAFKCNPRSCTQTIEAQTRTLLKIQVVVVVVVALLFCLCVVFVFVYGLGFFLKRNRLNDDDLKPLKTNTKT